MSEDVGGGELSSLRVVIADDDPGLRASLGALVKRHPVMELVAAVDSGEATLDALVAHAVDVVPLDVEMPGLGGIETARRIRREHPVVTVIMLTAFERRGRLDEAIAADVHGFLTKDAPLDLVIEQVRSARAGQRVLGASAQQALLDQRRRIVADRREWADFRDRARALPARLGPTLVELAQGHTNRQIARTLTMQESTIRGYVSEILAVTGCENRAQLVFAVARSGVLDELV